MGTHLTKAFKERNINSGGGFPFPSVEISTKLPDGSMITETYRYKKMPRHP